jgi:hypothetical protein
VAPGGIIGRGRSRIARNSGAASTWDLVQDEPSCEELMPVICDITVFIVLSRRDYESHGDGFRSLHTLTSPDHRPARDSVECQISALTWARQQRTRHMNHTRNMFNRSFHLKALLILVVNCSEVWGVETETYRFYYRNFV